MNEPEDNHQVITKYLLGSLAEAEAERLDELSFTDDAFAQALKSAEKELVDSYARGELKDEALEKFESYYLASPFRRQKAEFAKAFQIFAERSVTETSKENVVPQKPTPKKIGEGFFSSVLNIFASPYPALTWGVIAAALTIVCLGGWWLAVTRFKQTTDDIQVKQEPTPQPREQERQNQPNVPNLVKPNPESKNEQAQLSDEERTRREQDLKKEQAQQQNQQRLAKELRVPKRQLSPAKLSIASFVLVLPMRGAASIQNLSIPPRTDLVNMRLPLESDDYAGYRVALTDQSGRENLWRSGKLKTKGSSENKVLNIRFPAKLLKSQVYLLIVSGVGSDGAVEIINNYPFRAVLK